MSDFKLETPVVFIIFNRPDTTKRVFDEIRKVRPPKLFVIADGPRIDKEGEELKCQMVREIVTQVDWECEVFKNFSDINLNCKVRISSGLDWVFENVEEAIILEDDCVPHQSFFRYCQELLERYRENDKVMMISGNNFLFEKHIPKSSYYFSKYSRIWGWATWRRAWALYDVGIKDWPEHKNVVKTLSKDYWMQRYYIRAFSRVYTGELDSWAYGWFYTVLKNKAFSVAPSKNLVYNIGFSPNATHTKSAKDLRANMKAYDIGFPLKHPDIVRWDDKCDLIEERVFRPSNRERVVKRLKKKVKSTVKSIVKKLLNL